MAGKTKLELTWIGKDERPRLEPRILVEEPEYSYHAKTRKEGDIFDNRLIHGDNLLALKALETDPSVRGKVKCIFIDPPYNTGSAFEHYDDGIEHSLWLSMMRDRLVVLRNLLALDGSIWITIDDNESHYLKVLCDEVFGRSCFIGEVIWRTSDNSNNNATKFSRDHNYILVYGREPGWRPKFINDPSKRKHFKNPDNDPKGPWFDGNPVNNPALRPSLQFDLIGPFGDVIKHPPNGWRWSKETIIEKIAAGEIRYSVDGKRLIRRTYLKDMDSGLPPSSLWVDLEETGHNRQAKYELKAIFPDVPVSSLFGTPKPERLINKMIELASDAGDVVLDSFAGSGTTGAVAHKMGRRWIMVELGEHAKTHIVPRMKKVIDGEDKGGVTEATNWKGGGGYRFYRLAPSLLQKDRWGNLVINKDYKPEMLAEAMCKHFNYLYAPSSEHYWMHGHATETAFIYVTTNSLTIEQLRALSEEVGENRSLLVCCRAYEAAGDKLTNLTIKKIPRVVLDRCEWGKDDYSLKIAALPLREDEPEAEEVKPVRTRKTKTTAAQPNLFEGTEEN